MQPFTVIGFYQDTCQKFCECFDAATARMAEELCGARFPGVTVCGVIGGRHICLDQTPTIAG
jgi:hypothetical protein